MAASANVMAARGVAGQGAVRQGKDSFELVAVTRMFWLGMVRLGGAGRGLAGQGLFELVAVFANVLAWLGWARRGAARIGRARTL